MNKMHIHMCVANQNILGHILSISLNEFLIIKSRLMKRVS